MQRTSLTVGFWHAVILVSSVFGPISATENVSSTLTLPRLSEFMEHVCPYDAICRHGEPRLQLPNEPGKESCCAECSCEETCGLTHTCCFPRLDINSPDNRRHQPCIAASTKEPKDGQTFYMVVNQPANGRREECGNESITCGENDLATPLGSLYPVSDKSSGIIYKNEKCALCHSVSKGELIVWDAVVVCSVWDKNKKVTLDVGTFMQSFDTGKLSEWCAYKFFYPGSTKDVKSEMCYEDTVHHCTHERIPDQLNMTGEEIKAACLSDFKAPYLKHFFNIFCYLCNNQPLLPERQCDELETLEDFSSWDNPLLDHSTFSAIMDPGYMEKKEKAASSNRATQERTVCRIRKGQEMDYSDCRQALCPSGQVLLGQTCAYPTQKVISKNMIVALKLYPSESMHASSLDFVKGRLEAKVSWKSILWTRGLRPWTLKTILYNQKLHEDGDTIVNYLWIKLAIAKGQNIRQIVSNVNKIVNQEWQINLNDSVALLQPKFAEFSNVLRKDAHLFVPIYIGDAAIAPIPFGPIQKSDLIYLSCVRCPTISKMFFCDQVALEKDEYQLDAQSRILHVEDTNRTFFPMEFSLGYDGNGDFVPKVCLDDAGFVLLSSSAEAYLYPNHVDIYGVYIVSFVCLLLYGF